MKKLFVIGMAVLLLVVFTMPAMAKVKIGGIVFTDFYYLDRDKANSQAKKLGGDPYTATTIQIPNITRLYGRWTNEDNVGMYIEFGIGQGGGAVEDSKSDNDVSVVVRHAYGWWDVSPAFQIMAGHTTTPFSPLNPSQLLGFRSGSANVIGAGYGEFYSGRFAQIRGTFKFGKVARLAVALVDQNGGGSFGPWYGVRNTDYQTNSKIPRIDVGVPIYAGPVHIYPSFFYQYRTVDRLTVLNNGVDNSLNSWGGSLGAKAGFGPFGISLEGQYGKNWGNTRGFIGASPSAGLAAASINTITNKINDAETYGFWVDLSYKFGPITPHVMYGQQKTKNENNLGRENEALTQMVGFSVPIDLAKGFSLRPEIMWYDDGDTKTDGSASVNNGKYAIYGVLFRITF